MNRIRLPLIHYFSKRPSFRLRPCLRNVGRTKQDKQQSNHLRTPSESTEGSRQHFSVLELPNQIFEYPSGGTTDSLFIEHINKQPTEALNPPTASGNISNYEPQTPLISSHGGTSTTDEDHLGNQTSQTDQCPQASYLGESGFMTVLSQLGASTTRNHEGPTEITTHHVVYPLSSVLRASYTHTFLEYCSAMCPIIDKAALEVPDIGGSLLLQQSLALVGSLIQPSLLHNEAPSSHYAKAKALLHREDEQNPLAALLAVMLFYW